ncbi:hypothetical protein TcWFU_000305 [Taenia crassiceps]|uniref:Uncharacterized protein n=1 Tax=Taenia crassiceps TaxID=6207 RepID=A0ABR4Q2K8_9CEST
MLDQSRHDDKTESRSSGDRNAVQAVQTVQAFLSTSCSLPLPYSKDQGMSAMSVKMQQVLQHKQIDISQQVNRSQAKSGEVMRREVKVCETRNLEQRTGKPSGR